MATNANVKPFGMRDKIGYMFGDFGNDMTFIFQSMFLMVFYTEVLGIPGSAVGTLFLVSRIVDAFTDVGMGRIVDTSKPHPDGKFRVWIKRIAGPVAIASFLMYQVGMQDASMTTKMIYMYVTYLLWGSICYTAINIPYGSMASAITADPDGRTQLSTFRTVGATLAGLIIGAVTPLFIYDSMGRVKTDMTFTVVAGVFSILAIVFYALCYFMTTERVKIQKDENASNPSLGETFSAVFTSRSLQGIVLSALFMICGQLVMGSMNNYVFPNYYNSAAGISIVNTLNPLLVLAIAAPLGPVLAKRFGKKEVGIVGMLVSTISYAILFLLRPDNMYVFIAFLSIAYLGFGIFNTVIWACIIDVIDDIEVATGDRDDGTIYALYSFARKVGQALAGAAAGWLLTGIGYVSGAETQTAEVIDRVFNVAVLVPGVAYLLAALSLMFIYPLGKKRVDSNAAILAERRGH
ncbi:MFS transporter [Aerococcus urinaehominis]|uniref:MFS transporter n=1 Tax=Aerococcus urinaehominis TaxID=128944 RepID=A0A0X8FKP7_9LACT|nr:glycoside-pentoside-hexuronide (GPH):cation symporter [Aerococcus urinaehominis]AMB99080.1 MFS transporter [Aerococcus urinaehominis]SDM02873.1 glycoside/pentoside/hexuronide:cation symporter, GPH family [Aerococcus urinaehominis]